VIRDLECPHFASINFCFNGARINIIQKIFFEMVGSIDKLQNIDPNRLINSLILMELSIDSEKMLLKSISLLNQVLSYSSWQARVAVAMESWLCRSSCSDTLFFYQCHIYFMDSSPNRVAPEGLTPVTEIDLRALSDAKTEADTFLSVYLTANIKDSWPFVNGRLKAISKALPENLKGAFAQTLDLVEPAIASTTTKGERGRMIFASAPNDFLHVYRGGVELEPLVVWDSSPFLLPLARLLKDYEDYGLLLIDSQEYRMFLVLSKVAVEKEKRSIDLMNKHKKGGRSQMRFNRLRRGAIKSFLTEAVEDLKSLDIQKIKGLVIAGPGEAKGQLVEMLPVSWKSKVLGVLDVSMQTPSGDLVKLGNQVANSERSKEKELAEKLKEAVLKGRPAAYGAAEVGEALMQGRVNRLLLQNSFALPQMICKKCHFHDEGETCPTCGGQMQALSLEELYQQAERTGAEVVLLEDDAFLESIGGIGAILRY